MQAAAKTRAGAGRQQPLDRDCQVRWRAEPAVCCPSMDAGWPRWRRCWRCCWRPRLRWQTVSRLRMAVISDQQWQASCCQLFATMSCGPGSCTSNQYRKAGRQHFSQSSCDSAWSAMHVSHCSTHHACLPLPLSLRCTSRQQGASAGCSPRHWLPLLPLRELPLHQQPLHPRYSHQHSAGQRREPDLLAHYVRRAAGCMGTKLFRAEGLA